MVRVKSPAAKRHRNILTLAKGYRQARSKRFKSASDAVLHAGQHAYEGRKHRKRDLRSLWNIRINAGAREAGISYSQLMGGLKKAGVEINRKMLAHLAVTDQEAFKAVINIVKKA
jgi:large subunit ribosomal protein L20